METVVGNETNSDTANVEMVDSSGAPSTSSQNVGEKDDKGTVAALDDTMNNMQMRDAKEEEDMTHSNNTGSTNIAQPSTLPESNKKTSCDNNNKKKNKNNLLKVQDEKVKCYAGDSIRRAPTLSSLQKKNSYMSSDSSSFHSVSSIQSSFSRQKSYGNLLTGANGTLSNRKKDILMNLVMRLRFEEKYHKQEAGRDFTGPIQYLQFFREFFLFLLYLTIGPLSLFIIIPLLGKKIAKAKLFLPNNAYLGPYVRMLLVSISFVCLIIHIVVNQGALKTNHVYWSDAFLPSFLIFNYCMLNGLKYGYQDPINYAARK